MTSRRRFAGGLSTVVLITLATSAGCSSEAEPTAAAESYATGEPTEVALGATANGALGGAGQSKMFKVTLTAPDTLIAELRGPVGSATGLDFDLYVKKDAPPTRMVQDDWSHGRGINETLIVKDAQPGTYYVLVYDVAGSADYTFRAFTASTIPDADGDGLSDSYEVENGLDPASPQLTAETPVPWSGYWYPYNEGGTSIAAMKYDSYVKAVHGVDPGLEKWETARHGDPQAEYWVGHCHAWSSASIKEKEPTESITRNGIIFTVGDQKALLTELHFADTVDLSVGVADPKVFYMTLLKWLHTKKTPLIADVFADETETWNHPLYKYAIKSTVDAEDPNVRHYEATLSYASDGVISDTYVGCITMEKTYSFRFRFANGAIADAQWEGPSADPTNKHRHPQFFWHPATTRAAAGAPIDAALVHEILGTPAP